LRPNGASTHRDGRTAPLAHPLLGSRSGDRILGPRGLTGMGRVAGVAAVGSLLLLLGLAGGVAAHSPRPAWTGAVSIYQTPYVTEQSNFTVHLKVVNASTISFVFFTFCQLTAPQCYRPVAMLPQGNNWYVGTTLPMTSYHGMTVGASAGYNISIEYKNNTNVTEPSLPNKFTNLTVAYAVSGYNCFEMTVRDHLYGLSGIVSNSTSGKAIVGASVALTPGNTTPVLTNASGAYSFSGVANGTYSLKVSAAGYPSTSESITIVGQSAVQNVGLTNATTPPKHSGSGGSSGPMWGIWPWVIVPAVVVVALAAVFLLRRRGGNPPTASAPQDAVESQPPKSGG